MGFLRLADHRYIRSVNSLVQVWNGQCPLHICRDLLEPAFAVGIVSHTHLGSSTTILYHFKNDFISPVKTATI